MNQFSPKFDLYPAIDLRNGNVVRLAQGNPSLMTNYAEHPLEFLSSWCEAGIKWLHVVNLDGALGESQITNLKTLVEISRIASEYGVKIQFGGGIRTFDQIENAFVDGVDRIVLGTTAITQPDFLDQALAEFGSEHVAVGLDARGEVLYSHGWQTKSGFTRSDVVNRLVTQGVRWIVYTDINRDGLLTGFNQEASAEIAQNKSLKVIGSGGVNSLQEITNAKTIGLCGLIIGKALYENKISLMDAIKLVE
jgi:phosphoribosylformimino-5-aminoimidazole carboxamide ribotide isomerase